jgi:hypothetical protein
MWQFVFLAKIKIQKQTKNKQMKQEYEIEKLKI